MHPWTESAAPDTSPQEHPDEIWLGRVQLCLAVGVVALVVLAVMGIFFTTVSSGDFRYAADYWYTGIGLVIAPVGIVLVIGVHRLLHGADGRLGTVGVWLNGIALTVLFVELGASVLAGAELRWGPTYVVCSFLTFVGVALIAAGSWRTGLMPKWMLVVWPVLWIFGTFLAPAPMPLVLAAFFVLMGRTLTRRVGSRTQ